MSMMLLVDTYLDTYLERYLTWICLNGHRWFALHCISKLFLIKVYISPIDFNILTICSEEQRIGHHVVKLDVWVIFIILKEVSRWPLLQQNINLEILFSVLQNVCSWQYGLSSFQSMETKINSFLTKLKVS